MSKGSEAADAEGAFTRSDDQQQDRFLNYGWKYMPTNITTSFIRYKVCLLYHYTIAEVFSYSKSGHFLYPSFLHDSLCCGP